MQKVMTGLRLRCGWSFMLSVARWQLPMFFLERLDGCHGKLVSVGLHVLENVLICISQSKPVLQDLMRERGGGVVQCCAILEEHPPNAL